MMRRRLRVLYYEMIICRAPDDEGVRGQCDESIGTVQTGFHTMLLVNLLARHLSLIDFPRAVLVY